MDPNDNFYTEMIDYKPCSYNPYYFNKALKAAQVAVLSGFSLPFLVKGENQHTFKE